MKRKKLQLNKSTVSNLSKRDLNGVKGGYGNTVDSCRLTDGCLTVDICDSGMNVCDCSGMCTWKCPADPSIRIDCF